MRRDASTLRFYDCRYSLVFPEGGAQARYAFPGTAPVNQFASRFLTSWLDGAQSIESVKLSQDNALLRLDVHTALDDRIARLSFAPADFGHVVELLGYETPTPNPKPGQPIVLVTWWRVNQQSLPPNLTLFVHLLRDGRMVAQQDLLSVMADTLRPGDVFAQVHEFVVVPPDAPPGDYALAIGLYDASTSQRLTIYDGDTSRGDRLTLTTVYIR